MAPLTQHDDKLERPAAYQHEALNRMYDMLFCDNLNAYRSDQSFAHYPWTVLFSQAPDLEAVEAVAADQTLEARQRLLAYRLLTANGFFVAQKELAGVIVEVGMPEGLDVLAAFSDGTARYINYTEKLLVWDTHTNESCERISQLFAHSQNVVSHIGRWEGKRRPAPTNGQIRLSFLVADGLYFGEGPFDALYADPMGRPIIDAAIQLMDYLIKMDLSTR